MGVYFFATTKEDLLPVLQYVEAQFDIKYASNRWFVTPDIPVFASALAIPDLGYCKWGLWQSCSTYYIIPVSQQILVEYAPNGIAPEQYSFERRIPGGGNAGGVYFRSGGLYSGEGGPALLEGSLDVLSDTPESHALFNALKKEIRKRWMRVQEFYDQMNTVPGQCDSARIQSRLLPLQIAS